MRKYILIFIVLLLFGCSNETNKKFRHDKILTDEKGVEYIVRHHVGNLFTVVPKSIEE
jgi:hypothetical protein